MLYQARISIRLSVVGIPLDTLWEYEHQNVNDAHFQLYCLIKRKSVTSLIDMTGTFLDWTKASWFVASLTLMILCQCDHGVTV